jgi:hypothetical protein
MGLSRSGIGRILVSTNNKLLGRVTAGSGLAEEVDCTAAGRAVIGAADAAAQRAALNVMMAGPTYILWAETFI